MKENIHLNGPLLITGEGVGVQAGTGASPSQEHTSVLDLTLPDTQTELELYCPVDFLYWSVRDLDTTYLFSVYDAFKLYIKRGGGGGFGAIWES